VNLKQKQFIRDAAVAAAKSGHTFALMAACEAALESAYGTSVLAVTDRNLFGTKQHRSAIYGTHVLPTREFENGEWITTQAAWVTYPDWASCFADRMATLNRLSSVFPHYAAALAATDAETYVREVSKTWSTDPKRAEKVIAIYEAMTGDWDATATVAT
jgi:flagellum-specific peptidoglycan hydrolase FlgJ